ncbi:MAG: hypothetical protein ACR2HD_10745 [Solirubrobacteraceae bacterium]|nr:MAG: hypothetical protein DLM63_01430 [Solirubrobacterales bacterium]
MYRLLGMAVWKGGRWYVRRRYLGRGPSRRRVIGGAAVVVIAIVAVAALARRQRAAADAVGVPSGADSEASAVDAA